MIQLSELPRPVIRHLNGLWRRRRLVVAVTWGVVLAGWFVLWLIPNQYESRAHVFAQTETALEPILAGLAERPDYSERVNVMRLQLLTRPNVEHVIRQSGLVDEIKARTPFERQAKLEKMVDWVAGKIKIESPREMYFVISYSNSDPEIARAVVDAVLRLVVTQDLGATLSDDVPARRRLNLQIEDYEERLAASEQAIAAFRSQHAAELADTQTVQRQRDVAASELLRLRDERERVEARASTLRTLVSSIPQTTSGGELDRLKVELAALRSQYEETHPDIRGVQARIEQLENNGGGALSSNPEYVRLHAELRIAEDAAASAKARETTLRNELSRLEKAALQAPAALAQLQQIERRYETTRSTYEELLTRRDRVSLSETLGPSGQGVDYQIFERPQRALAPSGPPRLLLAGLILIIGVGAGGASAIVLTLVDKSFTQTGEMRDAFGLPILGAFSEAKTPAAVATNLRARQELIAAAIGLAAIGALYAYFTTLQPKTPAPALGLRAGADIVSAERAL
ncbi:MAG: XrtA system polysaccharide chain length determinant [Pseudomonadota bacterium]